MGYRESWVRFVKAILNSKLYGSGNGNGGIGSSTNSEDANNNENVLLISCASIVSTMNKRLSDPVFDSQLILQFLRLLDNCNNIVSSEVLAALEAIRSRLGTCDGGNNSFFYTFYYFASYL